MMTPEDMQDIRKLMPFVLTSDEVSEYNIKYVGQQKEDELNTYVFDISPSKIEKGKRYFEGRVWVDDHDLQIVKTFGKAVPDIKHGKNNENLFPKVHHLARTSGRRSFGSRPTPRPTMNYTSVSGDIHTRQIVKYSNYKRFGSAVKITYDGQEVEKGQEGQSGDQTKPVRSNSRRKAASNPPRK